MIRAIFYRQGKALKGFTVKGHSGQSTCGNDVVCASVSSAAYMTANTITDVIGADAYIKVADGYMRLVLSKEQSSDIQTLLEGFLLHVKSLACDYPEFIVCKEKLFKE